MAPHDRDPRPTDPRFAGQRSNSAPRTGAGVAAGDELAAITPPDANDSVAMAEFAGRVADATTGAVAGELGRGRTAMRVLQVAACAAASADALMERSRERARRACRAGCSFCCHMAVSLTGPEALHIAARLRATRSREELGRLYERVATVGARVSGLSIEQRAAARTPCALLGDDGACTIYEFRPLGCRSWTSLDRDDCERAFEQDEPGHSGAQDKPGYVAACGVTEGLERGLRAAGLDAAQYEFHSAVLRVLDDQHAADRFAAGEPVFAGCARVGSNAVSRMPPSRRPGKRCPDSGR